MHATLTHGESENVPTAGRGGSKQVLQYTYITINPQHKGLLDRGGKTSHDCCFQFLSQASHALLGHVQSGLKAWWLQLSVHVPGSHALLGRLQRGLKTWWLRLSVHVSLEVISGCEQMSPVTAAFSSCPKQRCPVDAISREVSNCLVNADFKQNVPCWSNFHTGEQTSSDCSFHFLSQAGVPCWYNAKERSSNPKWLHLIIHLPIIPPHTDGWTP